LPATHYYEVDSAVAGARYAIWVTTPAGYDRATSARFPVLYLPDGNGAAPAFAPRLQYLQVDPINPMQPFIMVCVGYPPEDAARSLAVRARDLLPPREALPPGVEAGMDATVQAGLLDRAGADLYLRNLRNPAGDKFLAFLTGELHPQIAAAYRVTRAKATACSAIPMVACSPSMPRSAARPCCARSARGARASCPASRASSRCTVPRRRRTPTIAGVCCT
jgi:hypothetical protein